MCPFFLRPVIAARTRPFRSPKIPSRAGGIRGAVGPATRAAGATGSARIAPTTISATAEAPTSTQVASADSDGDGEEVAEGDVRDAILALQRVHFALDSSDLNEPSQQALTEAAAKLKNQQEVHLYVEGHADAQGETEYNLQLGEKRAKVVQQYLSRLGVAPERLHVVSYGEEKPLTSADTSAAYAQNRRVDFRLMKGDVEMVLESSPTAEQAAPAPAAPAEQPAETKPEASAEQPAAEPAEAPAEAPAADAQK